MQKVEIYFDLMEAKAKYPDLADMLFVLRTNLEVLVNILKKQYQEEYNKWFTTYTIGRIDHAGGEQ